MSAVPISPLEATLALHIRAEKLPAPVPEYAFDPSRRWRFDFAWPEMHLAVEVDGHVHRIRSMFESDREKGAAALIAGWSVLHVTGKQIRDGRAIAWLKSLLWERAPLQG